MLFKQLSNIGLKRPIQKLIMIRLHLNGSGLGDEITTQTLSEFCECSEQTVKRHLKILEDDFGLIKSVRFGNAKTVYEVLS